MNIVFDTRPGEIFDFFKSLWFINNYRFVKALKQEYGIEESNAFESAIENLMEDSIIDRKMIEKYFYKELKPEYFTGMNDLWECLYLDKYLKFAKNLGEDDLIYKLEQMVRFICNNNYEDDSDEGMELKELEVVKERVLDLVTRSDIPIGLKWEFSLFLRNPKEYMSEVEELIEKYLPLYKKITPRRDKVLKSFNEELEENLNNHGLKFLENEIDYTYDFSKFDEVKITTTALVSLQIYSEGKICYVLIGPSIKKAILNRQSEDKIEQNLNFIRGISESTRYKILQLLGKRKYYGQEISDTLNITKTTTFYHLNFLISLGVVKLEKDCQKNYYSLNREVLSKNLELFNNNI